MQIRCPWAYGGEEIVLEAVVVSRFALASFVACLSRARTIFCVQNRSQILASQGLGWRHVGHMAADLQRGCSCKSMFLFVRGVDLGSWLGPLAHHHRHILSPPSW